MAHVTALAQHILTLEPDKDAARLCLYHFLKNLCEPGETVNSELLSRFYFRALSFSHWQKEKARLLMETASLIQHFQDVNHISLDLKDVLPPEEIQVVQIESIRTLEVLVERYLHEGVNPYDQIRVLRDGEQRIVAIKLQGDRQLRVTTYQKQGLIINGDLVPLHSDFTVFYTPDLQLHPLMIHQVEVGPHTAARFKATPEGLVGSAVRGYTFQRFAAFEGGPLHRHPILFYPLKRLEQFFVDRKTDPMYNELTSLLEKALELMGQKNPEAVRFAEAALERGRLALEHIFPDDKLVRLLINNLEKTLALESVTVSARNQGLSGLTGPEGTSPHDALTESPPPGTFEIETEDSPNLKDRAKDEKWPKIRNLPV